MDFSNRRTDFLPADAAPHLALITRSLTEQFGDDWLLSLHGQHRIQKLVRRRDTLSTSELAILGESLINMSERDKVWLSDCIRKIKSSNENQQTGALFELIFLAALCSSHPNLKPARPDQIGYDGVIEYDNDVKIYLSLKRFSRSAHENHFIHRANKFKTEINENLKNKTNNAQIALFGKEHLEDRDWDGLKKLVDKLRFPDRHSSKKFDLILTPLQIDFPHALSNLHYSYQYLCVGAEHANEQLNFIEKIRAAASAMERDVPKGTSNYCLLCIRIHTTALLENMVSSANQYLSSEGCKIDGILLYQPYVSHSLKTTVLSHCIKTLISPKSTSFIEHINKNRIKLNMLIGETTESQATWKIRENGQDTGEVKTGYVLQSGDCYTVMERKGNQIAGQLSNPAPGIHIHGVFENSVFRGIFPENDDLLVL